MKKSEWIEHAEITAKDSWSVTWECLMKGKMAIDSQFGDGYAKDHPELLGDFLIASALNYASESIAFAFIENE